MAVAPRGDLLVLRQDLTALSHDVAKLRNLPDDQSVQEANKRLGRVSADLEKLASELGNQSPGPLVKMADAAIDPIEDLLGRHPIATIALGFGLGLGLGFLWFRQ